MMKDLKKIYVTSCPAYGLWFERLVIWIYKWIGDEVHQEQAVVHTLIEGLESYYLASGVEEEEEGFIDQYIFILVVLLVELRGEEVIKLVLGEARDYFTETRNNIKLPHAVFFFKKNIHERDRKTLSLRCGDCEK